MNTRSCREGGTRDVDGRRFLNGPTNTPLGRWGSAIEKAEPRREGGHLMYGEPAATEEILVLLQVPLSCIAEVDQHSEIHGNRWIERNRG